MVFESVLIDILNRFLGPYVKNLDASQLQVSVWSGNITLDNLELKENALEQFNIPVRVHFGYLDKFRAKIPWKNLYNEPTIVEIDGLYVIAGPNSAFKFDPAKAMEEARNKKLQELEKFKRIRKNKKQKKEKQEEAQDQTFADKVITQVIKNLQVTIKNIHIRYEDTNTIPGQMFAAGISLSQLIMHSVDGKWQLGTNTSDSTSSLIYKLFDLQCLALYWNVESESYYRRYKKKEDILKVLSTDIADTVRQPTHLHFILMPVSANAKVQLDTKGGQDLNTPQALVNLKVEELNLSVSTQQYRQALSLLEEFDRLGRNKPYAKFRPETELKSHPKEWWKYAYNSVLSEIQPKLQEFSWEHIKHHRELCKRYIAKYQKKLLSTTSNPERSKTLALLEQELDVFNILLCREIAEERAAKRKKLKKEQSKSTWSSWLGWGKSRSKSKDDDVIIADINLGSAGELDEEKKKFYSAIGYTEGNLPKKMSAYPKEYIALKLHFVMNKLIVNLRDQNDGIAKLTTNLFKADATYRPTAKGLAFHTEFSHVTINGCRRGTHRPIFLQDTKPKQALEVHTKDSPLFTLDFEMNPLNSKLDFKIGASLQPIEVVYDAKTIDSIIGMFIIPPEIHLFDLRKAALATVEDIRTMSRSGLQFAIQNRTLVDIKVDIQAPYFIVPEKGEYAPDQHSMLILDLGSLHISSDTQEAMSLDLNQATQEQLESAFYDKFNVQLENLQALVASPGQDWMSARERKDDLKLHVIKPTGFELSVSKSLIPNDTRLPNLRVNGTINALHFTLSDRKIQALTEIVLSLPLPPPSIVNHATQVAKMGPIIVPISPQKTAEINNLFDNLNLQTANKVFIMPDDDSEDISSEFCDVESLDSSTTGDTASFSTTSSDPSEVVDQSQLPTYIKLLADIKIERIGILITKEGHDQEIPQLLLELSNGVIHLKQRTWDMILNSELEELKMLDLTTIKPGTANEPLALLSSEAGNKVFSLQLCIAERESPEYHTLFNSTHKIVRITTYPMHFSLHKNSLFNVTTLLVSLLPSVEKTKNSPLATQAKSSVDQIDQAVEGKLGYKPTFWGRENEKGLHLDLTMHPATLTLYDYTGPFIKAEFLGIQASITLQRLRMDLELIIEGYLISDLNPQTVYPTLLNKVDPNVPFLRLKMNVFKEATLKDKYLDLKQKDVSIEVKLARIRLVLLAPLIAKVVPFFTQLARIDFSQKALIDTAKGTATITAKETAVAAKSQSSSRIAVNLVVEAPSILIPLDSTSRDVFIIDVGNFDAINSIHFASELYGSPEDPSDKWINCHGVPTVVDKMQVTFSDLQINRSKSYIIPEINSADTNQKFPILQPVNLVLFLNRALTDCKTDIPKNQMTIKIDTISIHIKPQDLVNLSSVFMSLRLVQAALEITNARNQVNSRQAREFPALESQQSKVEETKENISTSTDGIVIRAILDTVKITVYSEEDSFADLFLTQLSVDAEVAPPVSKLRAVIRNFGVRDLSPNSIYPEILTTSTAASSNFIMLEFVSYQNATKGDKFFDPSQADGNVTLTIGKIRCYLIYTFINHILHTLLQFKLSRKTVNALKDQAKKKAASTATSTVEKIADSETKRLLLAVKIEAPVIIIPVSVDSSEGLVIDLGLITVNNAFSLEKPRFCQGRDFDFPLELSPKLMFDKIDFSVSSIELYRQISQNMSVKKCDPILQPFELNLSIIRTIPYDSNNKSQTMIYVALSSILMEFHLNDYKTILNIIQSNFMSSKVLEIPIDESEGETEDETEEDVVEEPKSSKKISLPYITFILHLDGYTLSVIARDEEISKLVFKSLDIELRTSKQKLTFTGELGEFLLTQPCDSTLYSKVISLSHGSQQVIRFNLTYIPNLAHDPALPSFNSEYDIDMNLEVGEMEVVVLYSYISKMVNFATNFSPKRSIRSEPEKPKEGAIPPDERLLSTIASLDNLVKLKQRMKINVNFKAPRIYIPQNSNSNQVIIADLGNITLKSEPTIQRIPDCDEEILNDNYQLNLVNLAISRAFIEINQDNDIQSLISIRPLTSRFCLELSLTRRITLSPNSPFLQVNLHLHEISLLLGSLDLEMITNLITDQIKEHDTTLSYKDSEFSFSLPTSPTTKSKVEISPKQPPMLKRRDTVSKPHIFKSDPKAALLSIHLQIDSVGLKLFHKEKDIAQNMRQIVDKLNIFNIPEEKGLANLAIVGTSFNASVKPNLIAEIEFILNDIVVLDTRAEKASTINRMLSRSILSKSQNPLLAMTLKRMSSDDLTLQIFLCELTVIFSTEFLMTLALFFWNPIEKVKEVQRPSDTKPKRKPKKKVKASTNALQELSDYIPTFRIVLTVKNPTIFLLENTDSSNPYALVGKLQLSSIIKHDRGIGFNTTFSLSQAMLYNCHYQTSEKPYSHLIAPLDMHMSMKAIPEDIQVHVNIDSISINLTPSTLALISSIAGSLKFPNTNDLGYAPTDLWAEHKTQKYSWFLRSLESIDSWSVVLDSTTKSEIENFKVEKIDLEIRNIDFKLDSEFKGKITPVLLLHSSVEADLQNWSTQLELEAIITSEASYFNEKLSTWEPLLEPSKSRTSDNLVPLRLKAYLNRSEKGSSGDVIIISDSEVQTQALQAEYALEITATDAMNLTVSRELIELLSKYKDEVDLAKSNVLAWNADISTDIPQNSVYIIQNELGININIALDEKDIFVFNPNSLSKAKTIGDNTPCYVYTTQPTTHMDQAILSRKGKVKNHYIHLSIENFNTIPFIPIHRTGNLLYFLPPRNDLFVVVEINLIQGRKQIIVRSPVKIRNEMDISLEIFYSPFNPSLSIPKPIGTVDPRKTFYVPFDQAYDSVFYLAPSNLMYGPSTMGFSLESKFTTHFTDCPVSIGSNLPDMSEPPFHFTLDSTEDVYTREPLRLQNDAKYPHHIFTAYPPSILHNLLSIPLRYEVQNTGFKADVRPGTTSTVLFFRPDHPKDLILSLTLFGSLFRGKFDRPHLNNSSTCKMHSTDKNITFVLGIYAEMSGSLQIKVFAPYWILNKSGVDLEYSSSESALKDPLMHESNDTPFLFPSTKLGSQVKLAIRRKFSENVTSDWSKSIAIGAIGSENLAESNIPGTKDAFQFGIRITTSSLSFTKIVIITPYNLLINDTKQEISIRQEDAAPIQLKPGDCHPFYPIGNISKIIPDTSSNGSLLDITVPGQILLHFDGSNPAIAVDISTNVSSNVITFQSYYSGAVPVQIVNSLSDVLIEVKQKAYSGVSTMVLPGTYLNYTWQDPSKPREIEWWPSKQEKRKTTASVNFDADGKTKFAYGLDVSTIADINLQSISNVTDSHISDFDDISQEASVIMSSNKSTSTPISACLYWVSFMDGLQRILLITDDPIVAKHAKQVQKHENIKFSFSLSIEDIGISLVDAITRTEIAYITLLSSDTVWQYLKNGRIWKTLSGEIIKKLESAYKVDPNSTLNHSDLKVDLQTMQLFEPYTGNLRRTHFSGVSLELQVSSSQLYFDIKIASIQVDNQMAHILYPIVFHSVALPTDALNFDPKPFMEASLILLLSKKMVKSLNIRYFKILVQEMSFNLDIGFVEGVIGLFGDLEQREWTTKELFELDYQKIINANITELEGSVTASQGNKHFIDYLHLSPLKINLSFSLQHGSEPVDKRLARKVVTTKAFRVLLDSLGVPGSAEKVLLQLKYLEIQHRSMTQRQIVRAFYKHYKQAGLTQIYKILLGLDVIGNPLALFRQIGSGAVDLFYEPYQGAIEGPEAFIVGVGHGISSLAGSTVGGVAGAVSKITSTVGKGLAALSFDTRYQRSRRRQDIRARTAGEEFFRGGKSFATGLFEGVTGVVAQPVRGVAQEGAVGLVKGIGKGLIGVVARPLGGGVDLLTATFGSLQKAVSGGKVLVKKRQPRFIGEDKTIRVFDLNSALGNFILNDIENGKYLRTVAYKGHLLLDETKNISIYIATNKKLIKAERKNFDPLNPWKDEDIYPFEEITDSIDFSHESKKTILILHISKQKSLFSSGKNRVLISTNDKDSAEVFANQFNQAFAEFNTSY